MEVKEEGGKEGVSESWGGMVNSSLWGEALGVLLDEKEGVALDGVTMIDTGSMMENARGRRGSVGVGGSSSNSVI